MVKCLKMKDPSDSFTITKKRYFLPAYESISNRKNRLW